MLARALAPILARRGVHYGWVVIAATFFSALIMAGAVGLPGAFIKPLSAEFHWDTAEISSALAIRLLLYGLMGPFSAALIERYGARKVIVAAQALVFVGLLGSIFMTSFWQLFVYWGLFIGLGSGMTALVLSAIMSTRWFTARRGLVVGILTAAMATGQLVFLPLASWLIEHFGWRIALVPSLAAIGIAAVAVFLLLAERPADVGLVPYGENEETDSPPPPPPPGHPVARAFSTLGEAARVPSFWLLAGSFFICGLSTNGLIQTHFIPLCVDYGLQAVVAASALAMMGVFDFFGTIMSGYLSDRVDSRKLLFWYYGLRGLSLLWLPSSDFTLYGLTIFAVFYGLDWIATVPPTVKLTGFVFGREKAGLVFGWIFASHQVGAAIAAFGGGLSRTYLLTYAPAFYAAGAACFLASAMSLMVGRSRGGTQTAPATA